MHGTLRENRIWIIGTIQILIVITAYALAFACRFDLDVPPQFLRVFIYHLPTLLLIKLVVFWKMDLFRGWWRYVSMPDLITLFKANLFASSGFILFVVFAHRLGNLPRSVLILDGIFCFLMMGGIRFATRAFRENCRSAPGNGSNNQTRKNVLVVGAGDAGQAIAREIRQNPSLDLRIRGFIDDDPAKRQQRFQGVPVLGRSEEIAEICAQEGVGEIIIAIPSATRKDISRILENCVEAGIDSKILPSLSHLIDGTVSVQQIRDVDVNELLGRNPVQLDPRLIENYLRGKRVLVTGAAGSIGSELCRQLARFGPAHLILLENAESPLFQINRELNAAFPEMQVTAVLGDIRNRVRVERIFDMFRPQIVFHAAAYKHVPIMEENPAEAADNNVRGTKVVADTALKCGAQSFVLISTDKAVNPSSVMGATKRAAELYVQSIAREQQRHFVAVRFGNVLESAGSVVPIFKEQIRKGGPLMVTHPEITRYFMTIPEAAQLVLQAASMGSGGEVFVLEMGEPVKILHLAEQLIRLSGLKPYEDIEIFFTGLRSGEKLEEELFLSRENIQPTMHKKIMVLASNGWDRNRLNAHLENLYQATRDLNTAVIIRELKEIVPEYTPETRNECVYAGEKRMEIAGDMI